MRPSLFVLLFALVAVSACSTNPQLTHVEGLGSIDFPNSGNEAAQEPFYRGVLLTHSFEFEDAATAFREAQQADPQFALAYWGEAMTYNHPLWKAKDVETGEAIIARMDSVGAAHADEREQQYVEAVRLLYGPGTKAEQDEAYMLAMELLSSAYPEDDEARAFYSLSVLGSTDGDRDFDVYEKAAAIAQPVLERNPNHPGAAHYIIHSYDDPAHAHLGLEAANAYSEIAPGAAHAQHMTTHIFLAQGDWQRVIANNIRAMNVSDERAARLGRPNGVCGHYSSWRHYAYLQTGEMELADQMMDDCFERIQGEHRTNEWYYFTSMRGHHILSTESWDMVERWMPDLTALAEGEYAADISFTNALVSLKTGNLEVADRLMTLFDGNGPESVQMMARMLEGYRAVVSGDEEKGLTILKEVSEREASLPFDFGPPSLPKPTHELYAEALLETGHLEEAAAQYVIAESRTPGRAILTKATQLSN